MGRDRIARRQRTSGLPLGGAVGMAVLTAVFSLWASAAPPEDVLRQHGLSVTPTPQEVDIDPANPFRLSFPLPVSGDTDLVNIIRGVLNERLGMKATTGPGGITVASPLAPGKPLWKHEQSYLLEVRPDRISIQAATPRAAYYAAQTLAQLMESRPALPSLTIRDWPAIPSRLVMIATDQGGFQVIDIDYWKRMIRELSALKISAIMPYFDAGTFKYRKHPYLGTKGDDGFTVEKAKILSNYAADHFVELVPQQNSLGHLGGALGHKETQHLRDGGGTINMVLPETLTFLGDLYDDLVEGFPHASAIHIGGDEFGHGFGTHPTVAAKIAEVGGPTVYAHFLMNLYGMLEQRDRGMMIWWHEQGFTIKAKDLLAKDIGIFDWHYGPQKDYPSLDRLTNAGFTNPWATPAVTRFYNGTDDWDRTFTNIGGFARAGAQRSVPGMCTCTWVHGMWGGRNMFELNLYGLVYSAECGWNPERQVTTAEFAQSYAEHWFGIRSDDATELVMRAIHTPYGKPEEQGFWRSNRALEPICGSGLATAADSGSNPKGKSDEARELLRHCDRAGAAVDALRKLAKRNQVTLDYLEHDIRIHRLAAERILAANDLSRWYKKLRPEEAGIARRVLAREFTGEEPTLPTVKVGAGAKIADGVLTTAPLAAWKRDGLTVGPVPLSVAGLQIEYDVRAKRLGKQFQQLASRTPSTHHYMVFIGPSRSFNVYARHLGDWSKQGTVGSRCKLNTWYHCRVRITRETFSFLAAERETGKTICRSGQLPLDNPGPTVTFGLVDNHGGPQEETATEWDNLIISDLKPVPQVDATPPAGLIDRLKNLVALHNTIETTFERSVHEAGGGSTEPGGLGKGRVNFRSRRGRQDLEKIIADLQANRLPLSFAE